MSNQNQKKQKNKQSHSNQQTSQQLIGQIEQVQSMQQCMPMNNQQQLSIQQPSQQLITQTEQIQYITVQTTNEETKQKQINDYSRDYDFNIEEEDEVFDLDEYLPVIDDPQFTNVLQQSIKVLRLQTVYKQMTNLGQKLVTNVHTLGFIFSSHKNEFMKFLKQQDLQDFINYLDHTFEAYTLMQYELLISLLYFINQQRTDIKADFKNLQCSDLEQVYDFIFERNLEQEYKAFVEEQQFDSQDYIMDQYQEARDYYKERMDQEASLDIVCDFIKQQQLNNVQQVTQELIVSNSSPRLPQEKLKQKLTEIGKKLYYKIKEKRTQCTNTILQNYIYNIVNEFYQNEHNLIKQPKEVLGYMSKQYKDPFTKARSEKLRDKYKEIDYGFSEEQKELFKIIEAIEEGEDQSDIAQEERHQDVSLYMLRKLDSFKGKNYFITDKIITTYIQSVKDSIMDNIKPFRRIYDADKIDMCSWINFDLLQILKISCFTNGDKRKPVKDHIISQKRKPYIMLTSAFKLLQRKIYDYTEQEYKYNMLQNVDQDGFHKRQLTLGIGILYQEYGQLPNQNDYKLVKAMNEFYGQCQDLSFLKHFIETYQSPSLQLVQNNMNDKDCKCLCAFVQVFDDQKDKQDLLTQLYELVKTNKEEHCAKLKEIVVNLYSELVRSKVGNTFLDLFLEQSHLFTKSIVEMIKYKRDWELTEKHVSFLNNLKSKTIRDQNTFYFIDQLFRQHQLKPVLDRINEYVNDHETLPMEEQIFIKFIEQRLKDSFDDNKVTMLLFDFAQFKYNQQATEIAKYNDPQTLNTESLQRYIKSYLKDSKLDKIELGSDRFAAEMTNDQNFLKQFKEYMDLQVVEKWMKVLCKRNTEIFKDYVMMFFAHLAYKVLQKKNGPRLVLFQYPTGEGKTIYMYLLACVLNSTSTVIVAFPNNVLKQQWFSLIQSIEMNNVYVETYGDLIKRELAQDVFVILDEIDYFMHTHKLIGGFKWQTPKQFFAKATVLGCTALTHKENIQQYMQTYFGIDKSVIFCEKSPLYNQKAQICQMVNVPQQLQQQCHAVCQYISDQCKSLTRCPIILYTDKGLPIKNMLQNPGKNYLVSIDRENVYYITNNMDVNEVATLLEGINRIKFAILLIESREFIRGINFRFMDEPEVLIYLAQTCYGDLIQMIGRSNRNRGQQKGIVFTPSYETASEMMQRLQVKQNNYYNDMVTLSRIINEQWTEEKLERYRQCCIKSNVDRSQQFGKDYSNWQEFNKEHNIDMINRTVTMSKSSSSDNLMNALKRKRDKLRLNQDYDEESNDQIGASKTKIQDRSQPGTLRLGQSQDEKPNQIQAKKQGDVGDK